MSKSVIDLLVRELDVSHLAQQAFSGSRFVGLALAAEKAGEYLAEARRHQARIRRGHRSMHELIRRMEDRAERVDMSSKIRTRRWGFPFTAVHFYASCWTMVWRQLQAIREVSRLPEVGLALRPNVRTFEQYKALRDHYEHLDERLPGRAQMHRLGGNDYGSLVGNTLVFGKCSVDVGPSSMAALAACVEAVFRAFKIGAISVLAREKPDWLRTLASRAVGDQHARQIQRVFRKRHNQVGRRRHADVVGGRNA